MGFSLTDIPIVGRPLNYVINGPDQVDTSAATDAQKQADDMARALAAERAARMGGVVSGSTPPPPPAPPRQPGEGGMAGDLAATRTTPGGGGPRPPKPADPITSFTQVAPTVDYKPIDTTNIDPLRQRQLDQLAALKAAAEGKVPSAAELQAKDAANRAASQQYGLAAALQGGMSAGGALRQASEGAARVQGEANTQGAILRAQEQARARDALTGALSGVRGQETELERYKSDRQLQVDLANQHSKLQAMGFDAAAINALLAAQLQAKGYSMQAINAILSANAANTAANNDYSLNILKTAGSIAAGGSGGAPAFIDPNAGSTGAGNGLMPLGA